MQPGACRQGPSLISALNGCNISHRPTPEWLHQSSSRHEYACIGRWGVFVERPQYLCDLPFLPFQTRMHSHSLSLSQETTCENENGKSKCTHASAWQPPSTPKRIQNQKAKYNATKTGQNQRKVTASSYSYSHLHSNQRKASSFPIGRVSVSACQLNRSSRFPNSERVGLTSIHRIRGEAAQRRTNNLVLYNCKHRDREMLSEIKTHERGFMGIAGLQGKRRTTGGGGRAPVSQLPFLP